MKQIEVMFERFIDAKKPLKAKWQMRLVKLKRVTSYDDSENIIQAIIFNHYHHNIYVWDITNDKSLYSFTELPADERGYRSILKYLTDPVNKQRVLDMAFSGQNKEFYDLDHIKQQQLLGGN